MKQILQSLCDKVLVLGCDYHNPKGGVALNMRYNITFFESFVIISLYKTEKIHESAFIRLYTLCVLAIIVIYNLR